MTTDDYQFLDDRPRDGAAVPEQPWLVLIVDDDSEVHAMTRLVMKRLSFRGRPVRFLSAHSGEEAWSILRSDPGVAVILLDVVMETDDAGLRLVARIREELGNTLVRIILRTGQPGEAPEDRVILDYDINDYRAKTELTAQQLTTTLVAALRAFVHIEELSRQRDGLERVVGAAGGLLDISERARFPERVLAEMAALVPPTRNAFVVAALGAADPVMLAGLGHYAGSTGQPLSAIVAPTVAADLRQVLETGQDRPDASPAAFHLTLPDGRAAAIGLDLPRIPDAVDRRLLGMMKSLALLGLRNLALHDRLAKAQRATMLALAGLATHKDPDRLGDQGLRLSRLVRETALALMTEPGWAGPTDPLFPDRVALAATVYDIGMVAVPDAILNKPEPLTTDERDSMRTHAEQGANLLERAARLADSGQEFRAAVEAARHHHERWDGGGYPAGLRGMDIPPAARVIAVADAFDALSHRRPWRDALTPADVLAELERGAGSQFDPAVVAAFFKAVGRR